MFRVVRKIALSETMGADDSGGHLWMPVANPSTAIGRMDDGPLSENGLISWEP
jgi:hypothetical protein